MLATSIISPQARRPFSRARHQQTLKYRHCLSSAEMLGPPGSLLEGYFVRHHRVNLAWSASFSCFGYFNEVTQVDVIVKP